ncbi:1-acyl-sn-glycerol-3-phosphate acyltransferase [Pediococcus damnosus]|uniref:1-acyl-sn-glycerol-3-phosphate acyltransferase n=1 Tax=Pediococcus damnosus TaxID=51663 RepID=UPI001D03EC8B|nr:1-acyl-sn-glycerol-3-phosphate acyltransferase [Pediococcus damnosus]
MILMMTWSLPKIKMPPFLRAASKLVLPRNGDGRLLGGGCCQLRLLSAVFADVFSKQTVSAHPRQTGAFIYANHTQPLGDALLPMLVAIPRRAYPIAEPANLGIPIVGRLLAMGGALILPAKLSQMIQFQRAMNARLDQHQRVFIYPEAHVWPYYTKIRPFPVGAFHYPVAADLPSYSMTITYQKGRLLSRPKQVVYFDGPFMPDKSLPRKQRQQKLHDQIHAQMVTRSHQSNVSFMTYQHQSH